MPTDEEVAKVRSMMGRQPTIDMARGVDLSALADRKRHQHRWSMEATYRVSDKAVEMMAAERLRIQNGGDPELSPFIPVPIGPQTGVMMEGPGCVKCKMHWSADEGYGTLCKVADPEGFDPVKWNEEVQPPQQEEPA